jgi:hypothetical protein
MARGRGGRGGGGRGNSEDGPTFEARAPEQPTGFDDLADTRFGKKQAKLAKFSGGQGALMLDDEELEEALDLLDMWSDDDMPTGPGGGGGKAKATQDKSASKDKASKAAKDAGLDARFLSLGAASKVDFVADFRTRKDADSSSAAAGGSSALPPSPRPSEAPEMMPTPERPKLAEARLPEGVQLMGGEVTYEEQEDGSFALLVPDAAHLKLSLNATPWVLEEDGKLHSFTVVVRGCHGLPTAPQPSSRSFADASADGGRTRAQLLLTSRIRATLRPPVHSLRCASTRCRACRCPSSMEVRRRRRARRWTRCCCTRMAAWARSTTWARPRRRCAPSGGRGSS